VVGTPCGNEAVVAGGTTLAPVQVLIDPGHGGLEEPGSVGPNGLREADVNLDVALRLEQWLVQQGVSVQMTRRTDLRLSLATRAELATALPPLLFVSVHHNGGPVGPSPVPGTLVFHQADDANSRRLAGLVYENLSAALQPLNLSWAAGFPPGAMTVRNAEGIDYYAVLRRTPGIPAVISEAMYITNGPEAAALADPAVLQLEAEAIGAGIMRYLAGIDQGSGFRPQQVFGPGSVPTYVEQPCVDPPLG
jgi:N-acetylmuramoyl-L-alanine amidase